MHAGVVGVVAAFEEEAGETRATKTKPGQRGVPIPSALVPMLKAMRERSAQDGRTLAFGRFREAAAQRGRSVPAHLKPADVTGPRLPEGTATTMIVTFRSLGDSGITWEALGGTSADRIQTRARHELIATTLAYCNPVEDLKGKFGAPFGPLPFEPNQSKEQPKLLGSSQNKAPTAGLVVCRSSPAAWRAGPLGPGAPAAGLDLSCTESAEPDASPSEADGVQERQSPAAWIVDRQRRSIVNMLRLQDSNLRPGG